jgi:hypothetical protein
MAITKSNPTTKTVAIENGTMKDARVLDWDKFAGFDQGMSRIQKRYDMGQKKTPTGPGTLKPSRGKRR